MPSFVRGSLQAFMQPAFQRKVLVPHPIFTYNAVQDKTEQGGVIVWDCGKG